MAAVQCPSRLDSDHSHVAGGAHHHLYPGTVQNVGGTSGSDNHQHGPVPTIGSAGGGFNQCLGVCSKIAFASWSKARSLRPVLLNLEPAHVPSSVHGLVTVSPGPPR